MEKEDIKLEVFESKVDLKTNLPDLKEKFRQEIDNKYNVVVTSDSVKASKTLMANINKDKQSFNAACKSVIDQLSAPINEFKTEQKNIASMFDEAYQAVKSQVAEFEAGKIEQAKQAIAEYASKVCADKDINADSVTVSDLAKLTSVTESGKLAKATRDQIDSRVAAVESEILRQKLEAEEKAKRDREIAEKAKQEAEERARQRQREYEEQARQREEKLKQEAEEDKQKAIEDAKKTWQESKPTQETNPAPKPQVKAESGKIAWHIVINCSTQTPDHINAEQVKTKVSNMLQNKDINFDSVEVHHA